MHAMRENISLISIHSHIYPNKLEILLFINNEKYAVFLVDDDGQ